MMDLWMQMEYWRFVLPSVVLAAVYMLSLAAAVWVTYATTRRRVLRDVHLHLDEHTREQVTEWRARVESLEAENERLRRRNGSLTAMCRGAVSILTGVESGGDE